MGKTIGITGVVGFMGSHLRGHLRREKDVEVPYFKDEYFNSRG
jgi:nucleoside-diphosphate-sugar epimerase